MVSEEEIVAYHESGHLVIGYRSGVARPYEFTMDLEHAQLDGYIEAEENDEMPRAAEALVRTAFAGPLAEMKRQAIDAIGEGASFDLTDDAVDLLSLTGHQGQVRLRFVRDGGVHELTHEAAAFATDIGRVLRLIWKGFLTEAQVLEELKVVRSELDTAHIWSQVTRAAELLLTAPKWNVKRQGFHARTIDTLLAELDKLHP